MKMLRSFVFWLLCNILSVTQALALGAKTNFFADNMPELPKSAGILLMPIYGHDYLEEGEQKEVGAALQAEIKSYGFNVSWARFDTITPEQDPQKLVSYYPMLVSQNYVYTDTVEKARGDLVKLMAYTGNLVIFPTVVQREAELKGELARWDGVNQKLKSTGTWDEGIWSGAIAAYSIKLDGFTPDGKWLFTTYGGISVPVTANIKTRKYERKENLFAHKKDKEAMLKGVAKACYPLRKRLKVK